MKQIPNILSTLRIIILPFFAYSIFQDNFLVAGVLLVVSGISDFLDGFLARTFSWKTRLGELLDPLADKLTQLTIAFIFVFYLEEFRAFFAILFAKDIIMLIGSAVSYKKEISIPAAKWWGKIATALFYIATILIMLFPNIDPIIKKVLLSTVVLSSIFSLLMYAKMFLTDNK